MRSTAWIGVTARLRDAQITLVQGATTSEKNDLGFVPLCTRPVRVGWVHGGASASTPTVWRAALAEPSTPR